MTADGGRMAMGDKILNLYDVTKIYQVKNQQVTALKEITITFMKNTFYSIMGPSGSGKTTLLNVTGLLDRPTSGRILFEGKDVQNLSDEKLTIVRRNHFGYLFQRANLIPHYTVYDNVETSLLLSRPNMSSKEADQRIRDVLSWVNMEHKINAYPYQLSGGEQQRVAVARALVHHPDIVLLDEPTGTLDRKNSDRVLELIVQLQEELHNTFILVTHDKDVAKRADQILQLKDGRLFY